MTVKGNQVTYTQMKKWKKQGYFPVCCRLCGEIELFPSDKYSKLDFLGHECYLCKKKGSEKNDVYY